ncbi:hypothetical protein FN846DRAFT_1019228 [Sphaerosporella brunnea]|uniref:Uncharacterized protein n=1 Tax=Sphaerosporella brunnea TaxID=1250544 RepID=A0A5J5F6U1_9PEZI|nr:hypothetical protein FN846DRAFT_1019228 [Sphaerosporella brunnea]
MPRRRFSDTAAFSFNPLEEYAPPRSRRRLELLKMAFDSDLILPALESLWTPPASSHSSSSDLDGESPRPASYSYTPQQLQTPQRSRSQTLASILSYSVGSYSAPSPRAWLRTLSPQSPTPVTRAPSPGDTNTDLILRKLCDLEWWIEEVTAGTEWEGHSDPALGSGNESAAELDQLALDVDSANTQWATKESDEKTTRNNSASEGDKICTDSTAVGAVSMHRPNSSLAQLHGRASAETIRRATF